MVSITFVNIVLSRRRPVSRLLQVGPHFMGQREGTHIHLGNYVLANGRGFYSGRAVHLMAWGGAIILPIGQMGKLKLRKVTWLAQLVLWQSGSSWLGRLGSCPRISVCPGGDVQPPAQASFLLFLLTSPGPATRSISSLKPRAFSLSPVSFPPSLFRLPKELISFSEYKWTLSHKDTTYVVSFLIC